MLLSTGKAYLEHFANDPVAQSALLACSAALRLDDESAGEAIEIVAHANGRTRELIHEVKNLGCVWKQWDGSWYVAEEVRKELLEELYQRVPPDRIAMVRTQLAIKAERRAAAIGPDGQVTAYQLRSALLEAGYQRTLVPDQIERGGEQLVAIWEKATPAAGEATARSIDYLAPEIEERIGLLPVQVLFLRGMAARARHDRAAQERYFHAVWQRGRPGYIFGAAAHFFGLLVRDHRIAERALRDSVQWNENPRNKAQAYHSLGNLLAGNFRRAREAERAYRESLRLDPAPAGKGQVWHSLGNLLAKDRRRSKAAEQAYKKSLDMLDDAPSQAQVWHSLGNLLAKDRRRSREAEQAYKKSIELDPLDSGKAQVWHSLGNLLRKDSPRRQDAENAFNKSLELWHDRESEAHVGASLANLLSKYHEAEADDRAERLLFRSLEIDRGDPWTESVCHRILAEIYERRGDMPNAIRHLEELLDANRRQGKHEFDRGIRQHLTRLREVSR